MRDLIEMIQSRARVEESTGSKIGRNERADIAKVQKYISIITTRQIRSSDKTRRLSFASKIQDLGRLFMLDLKADGVSLVTRVDVHQEVDSVMRKEPFDYWVTFDPRPVPWGKKGDDSERDRRQAEIDYWTELYEKDVVILEKYGLKAGSKAPTLNDKGKPVVWIAKRDVANL